MMISRLKAAALFLFAGTLFGCGSHQAAPPVATTQTYAKHAAIRKSLVIHNTAGTFTVDEMLIPTAYSGPTGIVSGPNNDVWFAETATGTGGSIVRTTQTGDMVEMPVPYRVNGLAQGADGNLWFVESASGIGRMTATGAVTSYRAALVGSPNSLALGPDGNIWVPGYATPNFVGKVSTTGVLTKYPLASGAAVWITAGPDGNMWYTNSDGHIGRITTGGSVTQFPLPSPTASPYGIAAGNGNIWFTESAANLIGRMTTSGTGFQTYKIPTANSGPTGIVWGPDNAVWFTERTAGKIGRLDPVSGSVSEIPLSTSAAQPFVITVGPDHNIWFTESGMGGGIGRVDLTSEIAGSDPVFSNVSLSFGSISPQLGIAATYPITITASDPNGNVLSGLYAQPINLTNSDPAQAPLSATTVTASSQHVSVNFTGHFTTATIGANMNGGGHVTPAVLQVTTKQEIAVQSGAYGITRGPNSSLWFCLANGQIEEYAPSTGAATFFAASTNFTTEGCRILIGGDGNVWFTDYVGDRIGRITPAGKMTFFNLGHDASPQSMTIGPDGALWIVEFFPQKIARMTLNGVVTAQYSIPASGLTIVKGSDKNLWINTFGGIYKMTTGGQLTRIHVDSTGTAAAFAEGFDGNIWTLTWPQFAGGIPYLTRIDTSGKTVSRRRLDNAIPSYLVAGPENSMWFVDFGRSFVGRIDGKNTFYAVLTYNQFASPQGIAKGPDGAMWFTESGYSALGRVDPATI